MVWKQPRDLIGYGRNPPIAAWPGSARLAVQFVLNFEEGGENTPLNGDRKAETFLSEIVGAELVLGARHISMESIYDYGARVGVWRILELFDRKAIPLTIFAVARAAEQNPQVINAMQRAGHEIACHGYRWINYQDVSEMVERQHIRSATSALTRLMGYPPVGWYTGRTSPNTRRLVAEEKCFLYDSDAYDDDLPYWQDVDGTPVLIIPYSLETNDMRFLTAQGFNAGNQFFCYLKDSFDVLYEESSRIQRMMSVGLHCRIIGRPGRLAALSRFLDYIKSFDDVWLCRRIDIAKHWRDNHPFKKSDILG